MYFELVFASVVAATTVYMCHLINNGPGNCGYQALDDDDDHDRHFDSTSNSESENAFGLESPNARTPRTSRWSSTTSSDESDRDQSLTFFDPELFHRSLRPNLVDRQHSDDEPAEEPGVTETEIEPLDSPVDHRLVSEPQHAQHAQVPWIINPLYHDQSP